MSTEVSSLGSGHAGVRHGRNVPWWLLPLAVVTVLGGFTVYAAWSGIVAGRSEYGPYLSPFYSPQVWVTGPISPALWVVWMPLLFRGTCYYYRKAYHRSFLLDPPSCAVGELRKREYHGETRLPFLLNNLHRFTLYLALVVLAFLWYDALRAFFFNGHLYLGLGTLVMVTNVVLLSGYTFGCHALRHLVGGGRDCFSCTRAGAARHKAWEVVTVFNGRHAMWAWLSLFSVVTTDVYIRLLMHGMTDLHVAL